MKNIILVDSSIDNNWLFLKLMNTYAPFTIGGMPKLTNIRQRFLRIIVRYLRFIIYPLYFVLLKCHHYDRVFAWQQFYGINIGLWLRILRLKKKNRITINTFIYRQRGGYLGRLYYKYIKFGV